MQILLQLMLFLILAPILTAPATKQIQMGIFEAAMPGNIYPIALSKGDQVKATLTVLALARGETAVAVVQRLMPLVLEKVALISGMYNFIVKSYSDPPVPYTLQIQVNGKVVGFYNEMAFSYNPKKFIYKYNVTKTCKKVKFLSPDSDKFGWFHWYSPSTIPDITSIDSSYTFSYQSAPQLTISFFQTGTWYLIPQFPKDSPFVDSLEIKYTLRFYIKCVVCVEGRGSGSGSGSGVEQCQDGWEMDGEGGEGIAGEVLEVGALVVVLGVVLAVFFYRKWRARNVSLIRESMMQNHIAVENTGQPQVEQPQQLEAIPQPAPDQPAPQIPQN